MKSPITNRLILLFLGLLLANFHPVFSQTFTFDSKVVGDPRLAGDHMGHHGGNAIFGDYMVSGAHWRDNIDGGIAFENSGIAFLYHWNDSTCHWDQIDEIYPESAIGVFDFEEDAEFGVSVALENDLIAIGSHWRDGTFVDNGCVYIYRIIDDEAVFLERLIPNTNALTDDREVGAEFGRALKLHGGQLIVGAPLENQADGLPDLGNAGAAYIYEWNNVTSSFDFERKLTASDRVANQNYGNEVSVFANHAVVAARATRSGLGLDPELNDAGAIYVYEMNFVSGIWFELQKIVAFDRAEDDLFGISVDMSQQHIVVGAHHEDANDGVTDQLDAGSVYIYKWNDITGLFDFEQKINPLEFYSSDEFGFYVAISNYSILVGSPRHDFDEDGLDFKSLAGAAYLFEYSGITWSQTQKFSAFDRQGLDFFGEALSINENRVMIGAWGQDKNADGLPPNIAAAGGVYIFSAESKPIINDITVVQEGLCTGVADLYVSGVLYDAYGWEWHEGSCDGPVIGMGETIEVNPTETTTYCVRAVGCFNYV